MSELVAVFGLFRIRSSIRTVTDSRDKFAADESVEFGMLSARLRDGLSAFDESTLDRDGQNPLASVVPLNN